MTKSVRKAVVSYGKISSNSKEQQALLDEVSKIDKTVLKLA